MLYGVLNLSSKIFYYSVALVRKQSGSTSWGFLITIFEYSYNFLIILLIMLIVRSMGGVIRAPFLLYVLTGVSIFLIHNKIIGSFLDADSNKPLLPVLSVGNSVLIWGEFLQSVYMQVIVSLIFLTIIIFTTGTFRVADPLLAIWVFMMALAYSVALGALGFALMPLQKRVVKRVFAVYRRLGIIFSGKMIPGNLATGTSIFAFYRINPLFHIIDQFRGAMFENYHPHNSNLAYPFTAICLMLFVALIVFIRLKNYHKH